MLGVDGVLTELGVPCDDWKKRDYRMSRSESWLYPLRSTSKIQAIRSRPLKARPNRYLSRSGGSRGSSSTRRSRRRSRAASSSASRTRRTARELSGRVGRARLRRLHLLRLHLARQLRVRGHLGTPADRSASLLGGGGSRGTSSYNRYRLLDS